MSAEHLLCMIKEGTVYCTFQTKRDEAVFMLAVMVGKSRVGRSPSHGDEDQKFALFG